MQRVGVVGANGFVGSALCKALEQSTGYEVVRVTRDLYADRQQESYDVLINCAMPSARFWAKQNPAADFKETVEKTANLLYGWKFNKLIQISTVSARCQLDTVYGRHKAAAETLVHYNDNLIVRFGALYGQGFKKGVLIDMLADKKVFVDGNSRYCFADVDWVAGWIVRNLARKGIVEVGGRNAIALKDVAKHIGSASEFEGALDHQEVQDPEPDMPEARDVLKFLATLKK